MAHYNACVQRRTVVSIAIFVITASSYAGQQIGQPKAASKEVDCKQTLGAGTVSFTYRDASSTGQPTKVRVDVTGFKQEPPVGAEVLVVPYPKGESARLKVKKTLPAGEMEEGVPVDPQVWLEDATNTSLSRLSPPANRNPNLPSDALVLWPIPSLPPRLVGIPKVLPPNVQPETVRASVSWTGINSPDGVYVRYCCDDRKRTSGCDYTCTETWQRVDGKWHLCNSSQPL